MARLVGVAVANAGDEQDTGPALPDRLVAGPLCSMDRMQKDQSSGQLCVDVRRLLELPLTGLTKIGSSQNRARMACTKR